MPTAVVMDAASDVGRIVARRFAAEDVSVVLGDQDAAAVHDVAATIESDDGDVSSVRADVRDEFDVERLMEMAARAGESTGITYVGVTDSIIDDKTTGEETPLFEDSYAAFDDTMQQTARGVYTIIREALPHLASDGRILVGANVGHQAPDDCSGVVAVSAATVIAVARQAALELSHPVGIIDTQIPDGPAQPNRSTQALDELAEVFWWAATTAAADAIDGTVVDSSMG